MRGFLFTQNKKEMYKEYIVKANSHEELVEVSQWFGENFENGKYYKNNTPTGHPRAFVIDEKGHSNRWYGTAEGASSGTISWKYPIITYEEWKNNYKNNKNMKKIIGYKTPKDLFGGKVKKDTLYYPLSSNNVTKYAAVKEMSSGGYSPIDGGETNLPKEIVEEWEPFYEEEFKVGDWVISDEVQAPRAMQIVRIEGDRYLTSEDGSSNLSPHRKWRKATQEEIEKATEIKIGSHKVVFLDGNRKIKVGCQSFTKQEVGAIYSLLSRDDNPFGDSVPIELKIAQIVIKKEDVKKILDKMK